MNKLLFMQRIFAFKLKNRRPFAIKFEAFGINVKS